MLEMCLAPQEGLEMCLGPTLFSGSGLCYFGHVAECSELVPPDSGEQHAQTDAVG